MEIKIGPAGLGPVKTAEEILRKYNELGIKNCEISFTYSVYIKKPEAEKIKKIAEDLDIELSIHAPYFVNLNSDDNKKLEATKQRILKCCERGHDLGAKSIVFHPGYYGKEFGKLKTTEEEKEKIKEKTYQKIKEGIIEIMKEIKKNKWDVNLCPETMGKINVFGSIEEISKLSKETGCSFCIDFAHVLARDKKVNYEKIKELFPRKHWHCHFSGIVYNEKGERHHINLEDNQWKELFENLPKEKTITIACESPDIVGDSVKGLRILKEN
jgi:deoxyribonuclease-4